MIELVLVTLIYIALAVGLCWLVIWVLGQLGVEVPSQVVKVFWVIVVLVVLLIFWRAFGGLAYLR